MEMKIVIAKPMGDKPKDIPVVTTVTLLTGTGSTENATYS